MARHNLAAVFHAHRTLEHALHQVSQRVYDTADEAEHQPVVPCYPVVEEGAYEEGCHERYHHAYGRTLPGLSRRVALPHLVLAQQRAAHIGAVVVHPHHDEHHHKRVVALMQRRHESQRYGCIEHRHHSVGRIAERLLAVLPQLHHGSHAESHRQQCHRHTESYIPPHLAVRHRRQCQQRYHCVGVAKRLRRRCALLLHYAEELKGAATRHKKQEGREDHTSQEFVSRQLSAVDASQEQRHIDHSARRAYPKVLHTSSKSLSLFSFSSSLGSGSASFSVCCGVSLSHGRGP